MNLIKSIYEFLKTLTLVDIIFFAAVVILMILVITLIYFIKINRSVFTEDDFFKPSNDDKKKNKDDLTSIVSELSKAQKPEEVPEYNDEEEALLDLDSLTEKLKKKEDERVDVTEYERDQEEKAIISYEELLEKHNKYALNYEEEKVLDDVVVKKVNLTDLVNKNSEEYLDEQVRVISYEKEEAFLSALKELNRLLN